MEINLNSRNQPIKKQLTCNICGSKNIKKWKTLNNWVLYKCRGCKLIFLWPQPEQSEIGRLYDKKYYEDRDYNSNTDEINRNLQKEKEKISLIHNFIKGGKLLDIGCGYGFFLKASQDSGWNSTGIEISEETVKFAREKLNVNIIQTSLEKIDLSSNSFDVITMWDFLEHSRDASLAIDIASKLLKKGGFLFVRVPNYRSLEAKFFGKKWIHWDLPFHNFHFSPKVIKLLLEKNNFEIIRVDYKFSTFFYNLLKTRKLKPAINDEISQKKIISSTEKNQPSKIFKILSRIFSGRSITVISKKKN